MALLLLLGCAESQSPDYGPHEAHLLLVALHEVFPALCYAEVVNGLGHELEALLLLGLFHGDILAHPVKDGRKLRVEVVVLGDHNEGIPLFLSFVKYHLIASFVKKVLLVFVH